jgi:hypothetical protein
MNYSIGYKIKLLLIFEFILTAHICINISNPIFRHKKQTHLSNASFLRQTYYFFNSYILALSGGWFARAGMRRRWYGFTPCVHTRAAALLLVV